MPEAPNVGFLIGKKPDEIIQWFENKGYAISWNWRDVWQRDHAQAFTVAKATQMDVLKEIRDSVEQALKEGKSFQSFKKELEPTLREKGWWGRKEILDSETGEVQDVQLGSPHRLENIYRTNMQVSYTKGRYKTQARVKRQRPYWMYDAVMDQNTRDSHAARNGSVYPADSSWWDVNFPPNGWGCRCRVRTLSQRQLEKRGLEVADPGGNVADEGWQYNPGNTTWKPDLRKYPKELTDQYKAAEERYQPLNSENSGESS